MMTLNDNEIEKELKSLTGWEFKEDKISKEFQFSNFKEALAFIVRVGFEAEQLGHHPNLSNVYNNVLIELQTHDVGNKVTQSDIELAKAINEI